MWYLLLSLVSAASAPMQLLKQSLSLSSWVSPSECGWSGVTCDSAGTVTGIALIDQSLAGSLPLSVFSQLPNLQRVIIVFSTWSNFRTTIPADICDGNAIQEIGFVNFNISTQFPSDLFRCSQLTSLSISRCELWGELPDRFGELPNLKIVELFGNAVNGTLPGSLARLPALEVVELYSNQLTGSLPAFASNKLTVLDVRFNQLTGTLDSSFALKPDINYIGVAFNKMTLPKQCEDVHFCYVSLSAPAF